LSISGKLTGTLSGFSARVKPAPFGLLCAWREVPILRQQREPFRSFGARIGGGGVRSSGGDGIWIGGDGDVRSDSGDVWIGRDGDI
jgi:hypothetical protein